MPPGEFRTQFEKGPSRVLRGGSWFRPADFARAARRGWNYPGDRGHGLGFRLCCDADYPKHTKEVTR
jgi:formylglycine-generating enzyme required for sulfatase activity